MRLPDDGPYTPPAEHLMAELAARKGLPSGILWLGVDSLELPGDMPARLRARGVEFLWHLVIQSREELAMLEFAGWELDEIEEKMANVELDLWDDSQYHDVRQAMKQVMEGLPLSSALQGLHQVLVAIYMKTRDKNVSGEEVAQDPVAMTALRAGSMFMRQMMRRAEFRDHNELLFMVIAGTLLEVAIGMRVKAEAARLDAMAEPPH